MGIGGICEFIGYSWYFYKDSRRCSLCFGFGKIRFEGFGIEYCIDLLAGHDRRDSNSIAEPPQPTLDKLKQSIKGLRVGIPKVNFFAHTIDFGVELDGLFFQEFNIKELSPSIRRLWEEGAKKLQEQGAIIAQVSLPSIEHSLPTYYILAPAEAYSNLARYDGIRYGKNIHNSKNPKNTFPTIMIEQKKRTSRKRRKLSRDHQQFTSRRIWNGSPKEDSVRQFCSFSKVRRFFENRMLISAVFAKNRTYESYYLKSQHIRQIIIQDFEKVFKLGIDVLLTPTTPTPAFPINQQLSPVEMYVNDVMTIPASLACLPAISVPVSRSSEEDLPLGLQLIGPWNQEAKLLNVAYHLETPNQHELWFEDLHERS